MRSFVRRLGSVKLTIAALLALAVLGGLGTTGLIAQGLEPQAYRDAYGPPGDLLLALGLNNFHTSYFYRALFVLLSVNLALCAWGRTVSSLRHLRGAGAGVTVSLSDREGLVAYLRRRNFAIQAVGEDLFAHRRRWAFLGFPLVHWAPLLVLLGGFSGTLFGAIYTQNIHVGAITESFLDWRTREMRPLPFALQVRGVHFDYHRPLQVKVRVVGAGEPVEVATVEGTPFEAGQTGYRAIVDHYDPEGNDMIYRVLGAEKTFGPYARNKEEGAPIRLRPVGWRGETRQAYADVGFYDSDGQLLQEGVLSVNAPTVIQGHRVFLTAWGRDEENRDFVGIQVTRDPGQPLMWVGSVLLTVGLCLMLYVRGAWVRVAGGELRVHATRATPLLAAELRAAQRGEGDAGP